MKKRSSLERRMLNYFLLIAVASLLITVEFIWAIGEMIPQSSLPVSETIDSVKHGIESLRNKAVLMFVVQAVETLIVLVMFVRKITTPLQQMVNEAEIIADGDLSRIIPIRTRDEIGLIGQTINALTSNIQEIAAVGSHTEKSLRVPLAALRQRWAADPESRKRLDDIETKLDSFKNIARHLNLLPGPFDANQEEQA
ncbi:MAG: HAMP domain-containing protein [Desulfomonilaceae bacterium]